MEPRNPSGGRYELKLSVAERQVLEQTRDHHPKPYMREHAAAILKVASGDSIRHVALYGLFRPRHPDTVRAWIRRFRAEGMVGLRVRPGTGRKPAFSPSAADGG
jgi:transposase